MKKFICLLFLLIVASCAQNTLEKNPREYQLGAYLWQQRSGEYRALCYQAYNTAKLQLAMDLQNKYNRPRAVIFDIDETVLDNSFGGASDVVAGKAWNPDQFKVWVKKIKAEEVPGARDFIEFATKNKVSVFFISNRTVDQIEPTLENFKKLNIPAKKENMLFMTNEWSKSNRRSSIEKKYEVVLSFGDNLHDFSDQFENKSGDERKILADKNALLFGVKYIVLPNPLYGDWENSLPKTNDKRELLITK